jgi:predicted RNase H-like nuclease (RuvC/YqgF family)
MDDPKCVQKLEACRKTVEHLEEETAQLKEENHHLRQAAGAFGQLAERLNRTLREERRRSEDRRRLARGTPDRRRSLAENEPSQTD